MGEKFLTFNSRLKLFPSKLISRWLGPVKITSVTPYGAIAVQVEKGQEFKDNGQRLKHYLGEQISKEVVNYIDT